MIAGTVRMDLSEMNPDQMRRRVGVLSGVPTGARVVLYVGALAPEPSAVRIVRLHERRLLIDIEGEPYSVPKWLSAIRNGLGELV